MPEPWGLSAGRVAMELLSERHRQMRDEGWSTEHDDAHTGGELASAAATYTLGAVFSNVLERHFMRYWPWERSWWKPKDPRRDLVRAGALVIAEIERLDRAAAKVREPGA